MKNIENIENLETQLIKTAGEMLKQASYLKELTKLVENPEARKVLLSRTNTPLGNALHWAYSRDNKKLQKVLGNPNARVADEYRGNVLNQALRSLLSRYPEW
jgi:hypothetical protein